MSMQANAVRPGCLAAETEFSGLGSLGREVSTSHFSWEDLGKGNCPSLKQLTFLVEGGLFPAARSGGP